MSEETIGYSMQNLETQDIFEINFLDAKAIPLKISDIYDKISYEGFTLGLKLEEFIAICILKYRYPEYQILRCPISPNHQCNRYKTISIEKDFSIDIHALSKKGVPDFLMINFEKKDLFFVEVKNVKDWLNINQKDWYNKYKYKTFVYKNVPVDDGYGKLCSKEEIVEYIKKEVKG